MKQIVNLTPHTINLNNGTAYPSSGTIARVASSFEPIVDADGIPVTKVKFGDVQGLPPEDGEHLYIVSGLVASALAGSRKDVLVPATGHPECIRNEAGQIVSVPAFIIQ
jgi:hypothetical protein